MAIKRLDPKATFNIICELDGAVESETAAEREAIKAVKGKTRYEEYMENLDESKLKIRDGETPDRFVIRCLRNSETADLQSKHMVFDSEAKTFRAKSDAKYLFDVYQTACLGMLKPDGSIEKVDVDELGFAVAVDIGGAISVFTASGKHTKKP